MTPLTALDIMGKIAVFSAQVRFYDDSYARPTKDWVTRQFYPWFKAERTLSVGDYTRKNDCDNFARAFAVSAQDAHARGANSAEAVAIGEFLYFKASGEPHAINIAFCEDDAPIFIEPQSGEVLALTDKERSSCFGYSF